VCVCFDWARYPWRYEGKTFMFTSPMWPISGETVDNKRTDGLLCVFSNLVNASDSQVVSVLVVGEDLGHLPVPWSQMSDFVLIGSELREAQEDECSGVYRLLVETWGNYSVPHVCYTTWTTCYTTLTTYYTTLTTYYTTLTTCYTTLTMCYTTLTTCYNMNHVLRNINHVLQH